MSKKRIAAVLRWAGVSSLSLAAGCTLLFDPEISGEVVDGPVDSGVDAPDASPDEGVDAQFEVNTCGGDGTLGYGGDAAEPGEDCGQCDDGLFACNGPNALRCVGAAPANVCGACHLLTEAPGQPCGACDDGVLQCEDGELGCFDAGERNLCGGCAELNGRPGFVCETDDHVGTWVCADQESVECLDGARNPCGGVGGLFFEGEESQLADACGREACGEGVLVCDDSDSNALVCIGTYERNACGTCTELAGTPGESCGACGGEWACSGDGRHVVCTDSDTNVCGGCSELSEPVGSLCNEGTGIWVCSGAEDVVCSSRTVERNECGGTDDLGLAEGLAPGDACGTCDTGSWQCTGLNRVECRGDDGDDARNACGGCNPLPLTIGAPCGACGAGVWECDPDEPELPVCEGVDADPYNACGGCDALDDSPGEFCAECNVFECVGTSLLCVPDVGAAECAAPITCAELDCESFGFECFESVGGANAYCNGCLDGLEFIDGECVSLSAECGDGTRDVGEKCDGDDLDDETCESLGRAGGELGCTDECEFDLTDCAPECIPDCSRVDCGPDPICGFPCGGCDGADVCVEGRCEEIVVPAPRRFRATGGDTAILRSVDLTWEPVADAESYKLYRDEGVVAVLSGDATSYSDEDAEPGAPPTLVSIDATDGDHDEFIALTWPPAVTTAGVAHSYRLVAERSGIEGPGASAFGNRAAAPVTEYAVRIDGGDWFSVGTDLDYEDRAFGAPELVIHGFDATADRADGVLVSIDRFDANAAIRRYEVKPVSAVGEGGALETTGFAAVDAVLTWRKSASVSDTGSYPIELHAGADLSFLDTDATTTTRWYVVELASGSASVTSESEPGSRAVASCSDGVQNGDETDIDCGGACERCLLGQGCDATSDCWTGECDGAGICRGDTEVLDRVAPTNHEQLGARAFAGRRGIFAAAPFTPEGPFGPGSVDVFTLDALTVSDTSTITVGMRNGALFGTSIHEEQGLLLISSLAGGLADAGSVRVFDNDGVWRELVGLNGGVAGNEFGAAVVARGDEVFVGVPADDFDGHEAGLVEVWNPKLDVEAPIQRIRGLGSDAGDRYGHALAMSGSLLVVGAPGADVAGVRSGVIEVVDTESPDRVEIWPTTRTEGRGFGAAIAASGPWVVVSDAGGTEVAVFESDSTSLGFDTNLGLPDTLEIAEGVESPIVGIGVERDRIALGVPDALRLGEAQGAVVLYARDGGEWHYEGIAWADLAAGDDFGSSVSLVGDLLVVGVPGRDSRGTDTGVVHRIELCPGPTHGPFCQFSCANGTFDGLESDTDCGGGVCGLCDDGDACAVVEDCAWRDGYTCSDGFCAPPSCDDGVRNGEESDVDCGGSCVDRCVLGGGCFRDLDCQAHLLCDDGRCATNSCDDFVVSGDETDVDCGGSACPGCIEGALCIGDDDCAGALHCDMETGRCGDSATASCTNSVRDGDETDVDCGGSCPACAELEGCVVVEDCADAMTCAAGLCQNVEWPRHSVSPSHDNEDYGWAVDADGVLAVIGDPLADTEAGSDVGAAYLLKDDGSGWSERLWLPFEGAANDQVGSAVAVSGAWAAVSALRPLQVGGEVHLFHERDGVWSYERTLSMPDAHALDGFGTSLAMHDGVLVVGAPDAQPVDETTPGRAFVYEVDGGDTWHLTSTLAPTGDQDGARFGADVDVWEDWVIVGAPGWTPAAGLEGAGVVNFFERGAVDWDYRGALAGATAGAGAALGERVAVRGPWAVASQPDADGGTGRVDVFSLDGSWGVHSQLLPNPSSAGSRFGDTALTFTDGWLAIGSQGDSGVRADAGAAYVYAVTSTSITFEAAVAPPDAQRGALGGRVGFAGPDLIYGAPNQDVSGRVDAFAICAPGTHGPRCGYDCGDGVQNGDESAVDEGGPCDGGEVHSPFTQWDLISDGGGAEEGTIVAATSRYVVAADPEYGGPTGLGRVVVNRIEDGALVADGFIEPETAAVAGMRFGSAVTFAGQFLVVSAPPVARLYVYRRGPESWDEVATIDRPLETTGSFGEALAGADDLIVAQSIGSGGVGEVDVFEFTSQFFVHTEHIETPGVEDAGFGTPATDGDVILLGSPLEGTGGAAYVYRRTDLSAWRYDGEITPGGLSAGDDFGRAVAVWRDRAAVAAPESGDGAGAVYTFRDDAGFGGDVVLSSEFTEFAAGFGAGLSFDGSTLWVASRDVEGGAEGAVYRYGVDGGWIPDGRVPAPPGTAPDDGFASSVAGWGDWVVVGVPGRDGTGGASVFDYCSGASHSRCGADSTNGIMDGYESDVDCGGPSGVGCEEGALCQRSADCADEMHCSVGHCAPEGFAYIPAGSYSVGSPIDETWRGTDEAIRTVELGSPFVIARSELTVGAWFGQTGDRPATSLGTCGDMCPATGLTWYSAAQFLNEVSAAGGATACYTLSGCDTGAAATGTYDCASGGANSVFPSIYDCDGWRLPTEVEWEIAARALTNTPFSGGDIDGGDGGCSFPGLDPLGWYCGNSGVAPQMVTTRAPNLWGIYDMHGNAREWTSDSYVASPPSGADPFTDAGGDRVLRGGAWNDSGDDARSAARATASPASVEGTAGLRPTRQAHRPPRCFDGIRNADEIAVDCGGDACAPCP